MKSRSISTLIILLVTLLITPNLFAQTTASLNGTVTDNNGAVVVGATVTATSTSTGATRTTTTNASGFYGIQQLQPGNYTVKIEQSGFKAAQINALTLAVGQIRELNPVLETGEVSAIINITSSEIEPAAIDQSSNRLGVNISAKEVEQLPVNGRNYSQLYLNAPGATNTGTGNFGDLRFNGRANQQNQTKLDGIEATAIFDSSPGYVTVQGSQFRLQTSIENIQEFRVDSSNYPAEYGTGTGGQITVIGKSGSNQFKGSAFYYVRNDIFDARNFFDGAEKSPLRLNQFGGSFGGPIIKDKLFFFGSYEGLRQRAGFNIIESTPSNFVRDFINLYDGEAGNAQGVAARNALNISAADATAALSRIQALRATGVINTFPIGSGTAFNVGGLNNSAQVIQVNRTAKLDEDAFSGRIDYKINDRFTLFGRYQRNHGELLSPDGSSGRFISAEQQPDNFVASLQQVYGTSVINETKFGFNRAPTDLTTVVPDISGLNGFDLSVTSLRLSGNITSPGINGGASTGFTEPGGLTRQSSAANGRAQPIRPTSLSFINNLSWTKGNHNFKFGGEVRALRVDFDQLGGITYSYSNLRDFVLNQNLSAAFIGDMSAPGDFRVATNPVTTVNRSHSGLSEGRQYYIIGYGQDEWRVRPNIVLSYGLRYEFYSVNREKNNRVAVFNMQNGTLSPTDTPLYVSSKANFGPRLGVTWTPSFSNGKTVIRAGGGIFYGPGQYEDLIQPIESNVIRLSSSFAGGLTTGTAASLTNPAISATPGAFTPRAYDNTGYRVPERVGQYGISVQQQLPGNTVLTVAYVGSQGRNLFLRSITNTILPGNVIVGANDPFPTGVGIINICNAALVSGVCQGNIASVQTVRQFDIVGKQYSNGNIIDNPRNILRPFGEVDYKTSGGRDSYNALQILLNRRFTQGLTLNAQYQYGKSYGNTQGSNEASTAQNPFSFEEEFGNNTFDIRQSLNITTLYELPIGKGKRYDMSGVADVFLGGWQIGGVVNARSGSPLTVLITRPDLVAVCQNAAGCNLGGTNVTQGFVIASGSNLPAGFINVINTPGGNASRNTRRPNLIPGVDPFLTIDGSNMRYLNPAAFAMPAPGTYGNLERNALKGPSFAQFDLTLQKRFRITETTNIEFRSEIYNLLNNANFANPAATLGNLLTSNANSLQPNAPFAASNVGQFAVINGTVGRTVGLGTNRQIQFALRLNF